MARKTKTTNKTNDKQVKQPTARTLGEMYDNMDILRDSIQKTLDAASDGIDSYVNSPIMDEIKTVFPDVLEWITATRGDDGQGNITVLFTLFMVSEALDVIRNEYVNNQGGAPSLFEFTRERQQPDGNTTSDFSTFFNHIDEDENGNAIYIPDDEETPTVIKNRPQNAVVMRNALTNGIRKNVNQGATTIPLKYRRKTIDAPFSASIRRKMDGVTIYGNYGPMEQATSDALCTFYAFGQYRLTLAQLCREIYSSPNLKPDDTMLRNAREWIENVQNCDVRLDASKWAEKMGYQWKGVTGKLFQLLIWDDGNPNSLNVEIEIISCPLVLEFAEWTGQYRRIKQSVREIHKVDANGKIGKRITMTSDRIAIRDALIERILIYADVRDHARDNYKKYLSDCKRKGLPADKDFSDFESNYNKITYKNIFEDAGIKKQNNDVARRNKDFIDDCLKYWKATKFISDFDYMDGPRKNSPNGIEITLNKIK